MPVKILYIRGGKATVISLWNDIPERGWREIYRCRDRDMRNRLEENEKERGRGQFLRKPVLSRIGFRISGKIKTATVRYR